MNRCITAFILFVSLGCSQAGNDNSTYKDRVSDGKIVSNDSSVSAVARDSNKPIDTSSVQAGFIPDTTINSKLHLQDYTSLGRFYNGSATIKLNQDIRSSPVALFENTTQTEYLVAYQYEGTTKNSFACFEILYRNELKGVEAARTKHKDFTTESGLHLGMTLSEIEAKKGKGYIKNVTADGNTVIKFHLDEKNAPSFIQRYRTPGYFLEITLRGNNAIKIMFGLDYA